MHFKIGFGDDEGLVDFIIRRHCVQTCDAPEASILHPNK